jgi:hypothetical protein
MRGTLLWTFHFIYRTPVAEVVDLLPDGLEPLVVDGQAFYNVALCEFEAVRTRSNPFRVGRQGHAVAYRLYARRTGEDTIGLFGLHIECDEPKLLPHMGLLGTSPAPCHVEVYDDTAGTVQIDVEDTRLPVKATLDTRGKPVRGEGSPFPGLSEAATLLRPPPRLFAPDGTMLAFERKEGKKETRLVRVPSAEWSYFDGKTITLELCFDFATRVCLWPKGAALAL